VWGQHLKSVREELMGEALQFVKEQRVRALLNGSWFPIALGYRGQETGPVRSSTLRREIINGWRFVRLEESRKFLCYGDYDEVQERMPEVEELNERIDLSIVSSVVSNVTATADRGSIGSGSSQSTLKGLENAQEPLTSTKITIHGYLPTKSSSHRGHSRQKPSQHSQNTHTRTDSKASIKTTSTAHSNSTAAPWESVLLTIHPQSQVVASEWLDGLLMLLNQQPITAETNKLVQTIGAFGMKVRMLNVRASADSDEGLIEEMTMPSREGVDEDYYYRM
jgi:engulfment/cell motility protein 1